MNSKSKNFKLLRRLTAVAVLMFGFGYALVPLYKAFCEATGINILALGDQNATDIQTGFPANTQVDMSRVITVEFDGNSRGPWKFKPMQSSLQVHPGELATAVYEFQNVQNKRITAQAIPSYAPQQAGPHFHKIECFCFKQQTLEPGEKKSWPVVFVIDPKLSTDVKTITLSYTFFEVGGTTPAAPVADINRKPESGAAS
ncbi:cytochrome c oxidase assembly protein CtaG [mine drainage metagenome]|uniref:Cytochrome c oxidase assembly protein CtaG n=1 Tax=mine drainage metagenome TaxID=410659 RepID=A0A1J5Q5Z8_9ZZZZ